MEYKDRAKTRKFKRKLLQIIEFIQLKGLNLPISKKITLIGVFVGFISLFFQWVDSESGNLANISSAFSGLAGWTGVTLLIIQILIVILIFSRKNKEKLKLSTDIHIKDYSLIIIGGIFTVIISINAFNFVNSFRHFSSDIIIGAGLISEICAGTFIIIGGILLRIEFYKNKSKIYINESEEENNNIENNEEAKNDNDKNMTLPF